MSSLVSCSFLIQPLRSYVLIILSRMKSLFITIEFCLHYEIFFRKRKQIFLQTSIEAIQEIVCAALNNKNPSVKAETASFLARAFCYCTSVSFTKKLLKAYTAELCKTLNESGKFTLHYFITFLRQLVLWDSNFVFGSLFCRSGQRVLIV